MLNLKSDLDKKFEKMFSNELFANEEQIGKFGNNKLGTTNFDLTNKEKEIMARNNDWKNESLKEFDELESLAESIYDNGLDDLYEAASLTKNNVKEIAKNNANKDSKKADRAKARVVECKERIIQIKSRIKALQEKMKAARKPETYKEEIAKAKQRLQKAMVALKEAQVALREANAGKKETLKSKTAKTEAKRNKRNYKSALAKSNAKLKAKYGIV